MVKIFKDKDFLSTIITLAVPITIQNFITSSLNLVDNLMVGKLGETAIASVGLANQYFFVFLLCILGINAGANIFMAQFWGKKDINNIKKVLGIDITVGFVATLIFGLAAILIPNQIMSILSKDSEVITLGATYLRIVGISTIFTNLTQAYSSALRSTGEAKAPMYGSLIGVLSNAFLNWVFIFGNLGVKPLGVAGAALATTIARVIELIYILYVVYGKKNIVASTIKELFSYNMEYVKIYFKVSTSAILNELVWSLGMTAFSISYSFIGTNAVATMQIATTLNNMFMVICIGLGVASAIMVGNKIGANEEDIAIDYSKKIGIMAPIIGAIIGVLIFALAPLVVKPFDVTAETFNATVKVLRIMAIFAPLRSFTVVMIIGVFRGGGDTLFTTILQACTVWLFAVPLAFAGAILLKLSVEGVFFLICLEEIVKIFFVVWRMKSGKWLRNVVDNISLAI